MIPKFPSSLQPKRIAYGTALLFAQLRWRGFLSQKGLRLAGARRDPGFSVFPPTKTPTQLRCCGFFILIFHSSLRLGSNLNKKTPTFSRGGFGCDSAGIRTPNLLIRSQVHYPVMLQSPVFSKQNLWGVSLRGCKYKTLFGLKKENENKKAPGIGRALDKQLTLTS